MNPAFAPTPPRLQWWLDARFGLSFHFGLYSLPARGEWVRSTERISVGAYQQYFDRFDPVDFDPRLWARLARRAGMGYAIFTAKHHDGFCLFDSKLTDYKITRTPFRRDMVRQYVDAFRAEGIRVGLYYSLVDWHHPDYPAYGDRQHPLRHDPTQRNRPCQWDRYIQYLHGQVRELLCNYGKIDLLVFDFSYWDYAGEKWAAPELLKMIRQLQPDIVVNDRLGHVTSGSIKDDVPPVYVGDFDTCELNMPHHPTSNARGEILPWELWITHSNAWCHSSRDQDFKTAGDILRALVNCVSKSGNLTLNLGPDARGNLPPQSLRTLTEIGDWMAHNSQSIHGCGLAPLERPDWGRWTRNPRTGRLYAHVMEQPMGHLTLRGQRGKVRRPRLLATGADAYLTDYWNPGVQSFGQPDDIFFNFHQPVSHTFPLPDPIDTVVEFEHVPPQEQAEEFRRQTHPPAERRPL